MKLHFSFLFPVCRRTQIFGKNHPSSLTSIYKELKMEKPKIVFGKIKLNLSSSTETKGESVPSEVSSEASGFKKFGNPKELDKKIEEQVEKTNNDNTETKTSTGGFNRSAKVFDINVITSKLSPLSSF